MWIKNKILHKFKNLTRREMDLALYLVKRQDESGNVFGVHNKAVTKSTGMSKQSFYNTLAGLADKNVITYSRASDIDYNVTILDNDFSYPGAKKEGFVNLQRSIFHKKVFRELKSREKFLVLWFIHITNENTGTYQIGVNKFYKKYIELMGVTRRVIRTYLNTLKELKFFSICIKEGKYFITYMHSIFKPMEKIGQKRSSNENMVEALCRRLKIKKAEYVQIKDTAYLLEQYKNIANALKRNMKMVLIKAITKAAMQVKKPQDRTLNSKYIHKLIREDLGLEVQK